MDNELLNDFERLIFERNNFEINLYDYLVDPLLFIPDEFWEPVIVSLTASQIEKFVTEYCNDECIICNTTCEFFKPLVCCNNKTCVDCFNNWFNISVKCPFCKQDLRNFL